MLSDVYFPRVNGVSTSIRTFCQWLVAQGCEICLVAPDYGPDSGQQEVDVNAGFPIVRVPSRVIPFDPEDRLMKLAVLKQVGDRLEAQSWDLIHCHTPFRAHQLAVRMRKRRGLRVVETYHTYFEQYIAHYLPWAPGAWLRAFARWASHRLCVEVDQLIVPSEQMSEVLHNYGIDTPHAVIPTGIDLAEFGRGDGPAFRRRMGVPSIGRPWSRSADWRVKRTSSFYSRCLPLCVNAIPICCFSSPEKGPMPAGFVRSVVDYIWTTTCTSLAISIVAPRCLMPIVPATCSFLLRPLKPRG